MKDGRLLVVDDDDAHRKTLAGYLTRQGYRVTAADSAEQALTLLSEADPEVILSDIRMPGLSGIELLKKLTDSGHPADVILITAFEDMQTAVEAMRIGAYTTSSSRSTWIASTPPWSAASGSAGARGRRRRRRMRRRSTCAT
jgi:DNA-binding NtrC family response regulator